MKNRREFLRDAPNAMLAALGLTAVAVVTAKAADSSAPPRRRERWSAWGRGAVFYDSRIRLEKA